MPAPLSVDCCFEDIPVHPRERDSARIIIVIAMCFIIILPFKSYAALIAGS